MRPRSSCRPGFHCSWSSSSRRCASKNLQGDGFRQSDRPERGQAWQGPAGDRVHRGPGHPRLWGCLPGHHRVGRPSWTRRSRPTSSARSTAASTKRWPKRSPSTGASARCRSRMTRPSGWGSSRTSCETCSQCHAGLRGPQERERVGVGGSTGALLGRNLTRLRDLIDRSLAEVRLKAGIKRRERVLLADFIEEVEVAATIEAKARGLQLTVTPVPQGRLGRGGPADPRGGRRQPAAERLQVHAPRGHVLVRTHTRTRSCPHRDRGRMRRPCREPPRTCSRPSSSEAGIGVGWASGSPSPARASARTAARSRAQPRRPGVHLHDRAATAAGWAPPRVGQRGRGNLALVP